MFNNIGEKLKGLAYISCWGGIAFSVIYGFIFLGRKAVLTGILILLLGSLCSWVSSLVIYAIGEIAENTEKNYNSYNQTRAKLNNYIEHTERKKQIESFFNSVAKNDSSSRQQRCPHCGETVTSSICDMCGKENNLFK